MNKTKFTLKEKIKYTLFIIIPITFSFGLILVLCNLEPNVERTPLDVFVGTLVFSVIFISSLFTFDGLRLSFKREAEMGRRKVMITVDSGEWDVSWKDNLTQEEINFLNKINSKAQEMFDSPLVGCGNCNRATIKVEKL